MNDHAERMRYRNPHQVTSPRDFLEVIEIIHDGGDKGASIARINWEGNPAIGVRWNIARSEYEDESKKFGQRECNGMPSCYGHPQWFVMPEELLDRKSDTWKTLERTLQSQ